MMLLFSVTSPVPSSQGGIPSIFTILIPLSFILGQVLLLSIPMLGVRLKLRFLEVVGLQRAAQLLR